MRVGDGGQFRGNQGKSFQKVLELRVLYRKIDYEV